MYQERYWKEFYQLKVHVNYVELYLQNSEWWDKAIKMFLAVTSSSSIAGWALWKEAEIFWMVLIAGSQVIMAIRSFLPYKNRQKALSGLLTGLESLLVKAEQKWFSVSEGELTDKQVHNLQFQVRTKKIELLKKHLTSTTLPENKRIFIKAQQTADIYFDHFYPTE